MIQSNCARLRVEETSADNNTKHVIYKGVSANTWFSPNGFTNKQMTSQQQQRHLAPECRTTIQTRASSASLLLGKRHFEQHRLQEGDNVLLQGEMIVAPNAAERDEFCYYRRLHDATDVSTDRSHGMMTSSKHDDLPKPNIQKLLSKGGRVNGQHKRKQLESEVLKDDVISFRSVFAMHEAYDRVMSEPLPDKKTNMDSVRSSSADPRTVRRTQRGKLRPLVGKGDVTSRPGCGENRFKACLASDAFLSSSMQTHGQEDTQSHKFRKGFAKVRHSTFRDFPETVVSNR